MVQRLLMVDPTRLRSLRLQAGLDAHGLAEKVGVTTRMVGYWEEGRHTPEAKNVERLAQALACSVAALTGRQPGMESLADLRFTAGLSTEKAAAVLREEPLGEKLFLSATKLRDLERGRPVRGWAWRDPQVTGRLVQRLAHLYGVPVRMVLDAWMRSRPGDQVPVMPEPRTKPPSAAAVERWEGLNDRQRIYLGEIMREDRMVEVEMWLRRTHRLPVPPAAEWRRLPFALRAPSDLVGYTRLQERLQQRGLHDPGAGPTLHALAHRGLVSVCEDQVEVPGAGVVGCVLVEITRAGRSAARAGWGEPRDPGPPEHLLSEWLWRTIKRIIEAGPEGLPENSLAGKAPFYLAVGYKPSPNARASRGFIASQPIMADDGTHVREYRWQLTDLGRRHTLEYLHRYRTIYHNSDDPDGTDDIVI
ncbi:helix-turn-helix transcriptional regulator [Actinocorallia libanotica]